MLKHYLIISVRNLFKNGTSSLINIIGLGLGYTIALLTALFIYDELTYDRFHSKADQIFRVNADFLVNGSSFNVGHAPAPLGPTLLSEYPKIEHMVRIKPEKIVVKEKDMLFEEQHSFYVDTGLFQVFDIAVIEGDKKGLLKNPGSIVISKSIALKYFGSTSVLGKSILLDGHNPYKIEGVIADMPDQSHIHFDFLRSMAEEPDLPSRAHIWANVGYTTYVVAHKDLSRETLNGYLDKLTKRYAEPQLKQFINSTLEDIQKGGGHFRFVAFPLNQIHLHSKLQELEPKGNIKYVYMLGCIGLFILVIACFNYINLTTVQAIGRAGEVGVRKVLGAGKRHISYCFLMESTLVTMAAIVLSLVLVHFTLPFFNRLTGKEMTLFQESKLRFLLASVLGTGMVGLLASIYPTFYLANFQPAKVLKGLLRFGLQGNTFRSVLVVFQFAAGILLIIGTMTVYKQIDFMMKSPLGYSRDQVLVVHNTSVLSGDAQSFKDEILAVSGVEKGTMTGFLPNYEGSNTRLYAKEVTAAPGAAHALRTWHVDADFISTLEINMQSGRNFEANRISDSSALIVNAKAARILGYKANSEAFIYEMNDGSKYKIIGVMDDIKEGSMRNSSEPLVLMLSQSHQSMAFKITKNSEMVQIVNRIAEKYKAARKERDMPFKFTFLDEDYSQQYQAEERAGKLFLYLSAIAIVLACLGLISLLRFTIQRRLKEIGLRKILGAKAMGLYLLLTKKYFVLMGISMLLAFPISFWIMDKWLQDFAYRTALTWWIFACAGSLMLLMVICMVSFQVMRALKMKPVSVLKSDD